ncbi:MAG: hypothetical protein L0I80_07305, partial [Brevibacterium sp.]|nr:hypothetical protein [Brevibacterium sp.]
MTYSTVRRLTDEEHGTVNAALTSYADEIEDSSEAQGVRNLAEVIITSDVCLYSKTGRPRNPVPPGTSDDRGRVA